MQLASNPNYGPKLSDVYLTMGDIREIANSDPDSHWFNSLQWHGVSERSLDSAVVKISDDEYRFIVREYDSSDRVHKSYRVHSAKIGVAYRGRDKDNLYPYWSVSICACSDNDEKEATYFSSRKAAEKVVRDLVRNYTN